MMLKQQIIMQVKSLEYIELFDNYKKFELDSDSSESEIEELSSRKVLPTKLNNLIIDFSLTPYIDSVGVSTIIKVTSFEYLPTYNT
jgi:hypothetical protein